MGEKDLFEFDKTAFSVCNPGEEGSDLQFWLSRTPAERIAAVEFLTRMMYGSDTDSERMERILEVDDLK